MTRTTPREWAMAIGGGLLFAVVLVWILRSPEPEAPTPSIATPPVVTAPLPPPSTVAPPTVAPPATASVPPVDPGAFKLRGIILRPGTAAAIIETADGRQRLVRQGAAVALGVRVESVEADAVMLQGPTGSQRLGFADERIQPAVAAPGPVSGGVRPADVAARPLEYRLGMAARKVGGQTSGYAITDISGLPLFRRAGLQEGDVVVSVNGNALVSSEKVLDLPAEVAGAYQVSIIYERGGKRLSSIVPLER